MSYSEEELIKIKRKIQSDELLTEDDFKVWKQNAIDNNNRFIFSLKHIKEQYKIISEVKETIIELVINNVFFIFWLLYVLCLPLVIVFLYMRSLYFGINNRLMSYDRWIKKQKDFIKKKNE